MELPALNANILIIAIIVLAGLYGAVAGKQRLRILILSVYVGIVLAEQLAGLVAPKLNMLAPTQVNLLTLGLPILVFGFIGSHAKGHNKGSAIANILVGFLAGALIVSSALHLLPTSELAAIDSDSFIAMNLQRYHLYILGLLPIIALMFGFMRGAKKH